jgi:hypothetical protein
MAQDITLTIITQFYLNPVIVPSSLLKCIQYLTNFTLYFSEDDVLIVWIERGLIRFADIL